MILGDNESTRRRAAEHIDSGGILGFRTDTFYGLGADPFNHTALRELTQLKGRESGKPILVIISDVAEAERFWAERTALINLVCEKHWPGPLTVVARAREEVPDALTAGTGTLGLRLPADEEVRSFVRICGGALTATSANLAGQPPASTAQEVFQTLPKGFGLIIDSGTACGDQPSTVLDLSGTSSRLIREGALPAAELKRTLEAMGQQLV